MSILHASFQLKGLALSDVLSKGGGKIRTRENNLIYQFKTIDISSDDTCPFVTKVFGIWRVKRMGRIGGNGVVVAVLY